MSSKAALLAVLAGSGQEHLVDDYDALSPSEQRTLATQILSYTNAQWKHMNMILRDSLHYLNSRNAAAGTVGDDAATAAPHITPPPADTIINLPALLAEKPSELAAIRAAGMRVVASGEGAVLLMAGGSGTRLGVTIPKGMFGCDKLVSGRSLFAYHCQRIRKMEKMAAVAAAGAASVPEGAGRGTMPLLVTTSDQNYAATQQFFHDNNFFGLLPDQVFFSRQSSLPCYDEVTGRVLMEARGSICLAPGGNAGVYESLAKASATPSGNQSVLAKIQARGVRLVQIVSVDNILARVGDPYFFGVATSCQAEVVLKTVPKVSATEKVGVVAQVDGEWAVVEYTEVGERRSAEKDLATGELAFNCGNIASHCCTIDFLALAAKYMETSTFYHAARKTIPTINGPAPAIKLEAFIFDVFRYAKDVPSRVERAKRAPLPDAVQILQVDRTMEFAPIKNADGAAADTPTTAAQLLLDLHTKWVIEAIEAAPGTRAAPSTSTAGLYTEQERATALQRLRGGHCYWEISPLVSYEGEGLAAYVGQLIHRSATGSGVLDLEEAKAGTANI
ncbi:UDP-N-acetylglucosamine pyrophosphorylase,putative [Leishmania mexicana MHOM/GT/2001/U1103]|uniref:UDP-N-acetylglucosamine diphosphorylase n=1 Tax=Leishmania mexicana (strain MHOM/GT/2001/U1103) TaxID=929439 RepID=E9B491_LEIMU|nr:UDP-N-acetylglucosamine pyrophosphorylase,putative [Leishmania mexicana MHOM/GT/2001/U1103]CBZ30059.1 UDP-N-acetylglucosamine pyrophosphorylase,putative [Leishmania mexicana MHOM/GT/2001/U1103]